MKPSVHNERLNRLRAHQAKRYGNAPIAPVVGVGNGDDLWQPPMIRNVRNVHGDARTACEAWLAGSLWGNPIPIGSHIHVYGIWKRTWEKVDVDFGPETIAVYKHIPPPDDPHPLPASPQGGDTP